MTDNKKTIDKEKILFFLNNLREDILLKKSKGMYNDEISFNFGTFACIDTILNAINKGDFE